MPANPEWQKVFALAVATAKDIRAKDKKLTVAEATKKAWQTKAVKDAKAAYDAKKK